MYDSGTYGLIRLTGMSGQPSRLYRRFRGRTRTRKPAALRASSGTCRSTTKPGRRTGTITGRSVWVLRRR